jgi:hypothetical protein
MPRLSAEGLDAGWLAALNAIVFVAYGAYCTGAKGLFCANFVSLQDACGLGAGGSLELRQEVGCWRLPPSGTRPSSSSPLNA